MKRINNMGNNEPVQKIFDLKNLSFGRFGWAWWFWLFFFNNPNNPKKPRQLMLLWSVRNGGEIDCNNVKIKLNNNHDRNDLDGAVAAWYFDGEKMNHNFLLEQCNINLSDNELSSNSSIPTSFSVNKNKTTVKIGNDFKFIAEIGNKNHFKMPSYHSNNFLGNMGYSMIRLNHLKLNGEVKNEPIHGSALFHRVFMNAPAIPWHWGIFHFENGGVLTFFNVRLLGNSFKKDVSLFDGEKMHNFSDIDIKRSGEDMSDLIVSGLNGHEKINFTVNPYSQSSWTFKKKTLGLIPNKFVYKEYPSIISDLKLTNNKNGNKITLEDLGRSVGNAEHTTGFLL